MDCSCRHGNVVYDFCYRLPTNTSVKGRRFDCKYIAHLQNLELLSNRSTVDLQNHYMPAPRFVTAISGNHFKEGLTLECVQWVQFLFRHAQNQLQTLGQTA
ncbi:unnamed protein product [Cylicocyclus nassatus]|uniref:Uncharacterized protein n=1 Tax=Cylicocyclus nassatus TaxID=53992 RepID=A0AA36H9T1_CYLNA|nr:unnamed protein product [Cylicocyclus nassatus]